MKRIIYLAAILIVSCFNLINAQDFKPSQTQFMIRGYSHAGFEYKKSGDEKESTFVGSAFNPLFIFTHNNKLLFEAELEFGFEGNRLEIGFEYANVSYVLNDYATIRMGKFLLPLGSFVEKLHPAWINRLSNMPLGFGHDGIAPSSGVGAELRGTFPINGIKVGYSLYTTNGPTLEDGDHEPEEAGMLRFENFEDNNNSKAIGGRFAIFPFTNSSLEVAGSFYSGTVGSAKDVLYENVGASLYALDLSYVKMISGIKGIVDIRSQYNYSSVDDATYFELEEGATEPEAYTFENVSKAYYAQFSYRPTMSGSDFIKNLEFVTRYSELNTPEAAEWEQESTQMTYGINYWLSWRALLKMSYQVTNSEGGHGAPAGKVTTNGFFLHWALGF
jgi:hypothetical protein